MKLANNTHCEGELFKAASSDTRGWRKMTFPSVLVFFLVREVAGGCWLAFPHQIKCQLLHA